MRSFITAKTFPLDDEGKFQSNAAEVAYEEASEFGLNREQVRRIIQAYQTTLDISERKYKEWLEKQRLV